MIFNSSNLTQQALIIKIVFTPYVLRSQIMIGINHKVIYKNLQQIIKSTPQNSKDKENKQQSPSFSSSKKQGSYSNSQALQAKSAIYVQPSSPSRRDDILQILNSNVVKKYATSMINQSCDKNSMIKQSNHKYNDRLETYQSCRNPISYKSNQKTKTEMNNSHSKHSLKSTPKLSQINKIQTLLTEVLKTEEVHQQKDALFFNDRKCLSNQKMHVNGENHSYNDMHQQKMERCVNVKKVSNFNEYFNQIDALYTDLQDFLYMSKEKVMANIRNQITFAKNKDQKFKSLTHDRIQGYIKQLVHLTNTIKRMSSETTNKPINGGVKSNSRKKVRTQCQTQQNSTQIRFIAKKQFPNKNFDNFSKQESIQNLSTKNMKMRNSRKKESVKELKKPSIYQMVLQQNHKRFITPKQK